LLAQCGDEQAQSRFITQRILELREEGVPLSEVAVLFRSSFHSFDLELELSRADIPFVKRGGFKFIETAHVKDVLAAGAEQEGLLTLSTIHSAKGLEWEAVFVIWLVDGRFPSYHNLHDTEEMEEERRLLYVAVTRAKRHLHLSYPIDVYDRTTGMVLGKPSRFLDGLPGHILSETQVIEEGGLR
jgi:superfamily I DNA/RNA helicase